MYYEWRDDIGKVFDLRLEEAVGYFVLGNIFAVDLEKKPSLFSRIRLRVFLGVKWVDRTYSI